MDLEKSSSSSSSKSISFVKIDSSFARDMTEIERKAFLDPWSIVLVKDALSGANFDNVGLFLNDKLIGDAVLSVVIDEADITTLAIDPAYHRQGYASLLLEHMLEHAKKRKIAKLFLEVRVSNTAAIALYKKFGFEVIHTRKNYYPEPYLEDAYVMQLHL